MIDACSRESIQRYHTIQRTGPYHNFVLISHENDGLIGQETVQRRMPRGPPIESGSRSDRKPCHAGGGDLGSWLRSLQECESTIRAAWCAQPGWWRPFRLFVFSRVRVLLLIASWEGVFWNKWALIFLLLSSCSVHDTWPTRPSLDPAASNLPLIVCSRPPPKQTTPLASGTVPE